MSRELRCVKHLHPRVRSPHCRVCQSIAHADLLLYIVARCFSFLLRSSLRSVRFKC